LVCVGLVVAAVAPAAAGAAEPRYALANGCYAVRDKASGKFVARSADGAFRASAPGVSSAEPFRFKASALGEYLLYGRGHDFLADTLRRLLGPSQAAVWKVDGGGATDRYAFVRSSGCARFPEADTATTGTPGKGKTPQGEVKGTLDAHAHWTAFEFIGGNFHCGRPWSPMGIEAALPDCTSERGPLGLAAPVQNFLDWGVPVYASDQVGYPTFKDWPRPGSLSTEGTYWKWVERQWQAGLRIMVTELVDNEVLCAVLPGGHNPCNDMKSARIQLRSLHALENYIDAQYGGPGKGWMRIVSDPFEARRIANQGKLAVVIGLEVSDLFDCLEVNDVPKCSKAGIDRQLAEFKKLGLRSIFPVHKFDNALGGTKMDGGALGTVINAGQKLQSGHFWAVQKCDDEEADNRQLNLGDDLGLKAVFGGTPLEPLLGAGAHPLYGPGPHCNIRGLTTLGEHVIRRMIENNLIVEIDHMSARARNQVLAILESKKYSGVISAHSWASPINYPRIYNLGGMITPATGDASGFADDWAAVRKMRDPRFYFGFGYGSDMNGLAHQGEPNPKQQVRYPFKSFDGKVTFDRQKTGEKTFDYNVDGVAQYGLYAEWLENLGQIKGPQIKEDMMRGAEAYLQMWERTYGVPRTKCLPATSALKSSSLGKLRLGDTAEPLLRRAGQPAARPGAIYRYCVAKSSRYASATFGASGKVTLLASAAARQRSGAIRPGSRTKALARVAKRVKGGLWLGPKGKRGVRRAYLVRKGRVVVIGVAARSLAAKRSALGSALRTAGRGRYVKPGKQQVVNVSAKSARTIRAAGRGGEDQIRNGYLLCGITS
jgi:hypothetical protein